VTAVAAERDRDRLRGGGALIGVGRTADGEDADDRVGRQRFGRRDRGR